MTEGTTSACPKRPWLRPLCPGFKLREAILRKPLGLTLSQEELTDDAQAAFLRPRQWQRGRVVILQAIGTAHPPAQADGGGRKGGRAKAWDRGCSLLPRLGRGATAMA